MLYAPLRGQQEAAPRSKGNTVSIEDPVFQHAEAIYNQVSDSNRFWFTTDVFDSHSDLQAEIGAMAAIGVGDGVIVAVDTTIGNIEEDDTEVEVVIVTDSRFVRVYTHTGDAPYMDVFPRKALESVRVSRAPDSLVGSTHQSQGIPKFEARLKDGTKLAFASDQATGAAQKQRSELLAILLAELSSN